VLNADLIISVAGIPLIGVNLRAAIAGMETMLEYGMMEAWDQKTREWYNREFAGNVEVPLTEGEVVLLKTFGSIWSDQGLVSAWKHGFLYLTDKRLFLWRKEPAEILFETPLNKIEGIMTEMETHFNKEREELYLQFDCGEVARIHVSNIKELKEAIEGAAGRELEKSIRIPSKHVPLAEGENIIGDKKLWYLFPGQGILSETWKPGRLYLTDKRLFWVYRMDNQKMFEVPLDKLSNVSVIACSSVPGVKAGEKVLKVTYDGGHALFYGKAEQLYEMESMMRVYPSKTLLPHIAVKT
jgi:hypothetical protein